MQWSYPADYLVNPTNILRKAGYSPFRDPKTGEESFILRLGPDFYPRFHLYLEEQGDQINLNLHLDQKQPSYSSGPKHAGEYSGPTVEKEKQRLDGWVRSINR
jgi:hypothetical protein